MAQVSKRRLHPEVERRMYEVFWRAFLRCESREELEVFLNDLLTETERVVLAKRLAIAELLLAGKNYVQICEQLKVSPPTVAKVKGWLEEEGEGLRGVLGE